MSHRAPGPPPWSLLAAALLLCPPPARGGPSPPLVLLQDPPAAGPGDNVTFLLTPPPGPFVVCSWFRGGDTETSAELFSFFPGGPGQLDGPAQTGRAWGDPRGSLHLVGVAPGDAGLYSVLLRRPEAAAGSARLLVHEPLLEPSVTPENVTVTENETLSLSCHPPNSTVWVSWLHRGAPLAPGGRVSLSPDNRTLTVPRAQRGDAGPFACRVSNALSANRSRDVPVTVLYGPDAVAVSPPGPLHLPLGSLVDLGCSAASVPPPEFSWARGNVTVATGPHLTLTLQDSGQSGPWSCRATNPALGRAAEATVLLQLEQGLSPGAIAGIVVGTLLGLALLGAGGFLLWRHLGRVSTPTNGAKPSAPPYKEPQDPPPALGPPGSGGGHSLPPGPTETPEEVKYTTVTLRPPGGAAPPRPPQPNDTVYSEVRRK